MNLQYLETTVPGFSIQDLSHTNILSIPMGKCVPVLMQFYHPGESQEHDFDWLCRTMPMNAPLMDNMEVTFDCLWVTARSLGIAGAESVGFNFEEFFNPKNLQSNTQLPQYELSSLIYIYLSNFGRLDCTLYDYLGYPTFPEAFKRIYIYLSSILITVDESRIPFNEFMSDIEGLDPSIFNLWHYSASHLSDLTVRTNFPTPLVNNTYQNSDLADYYLYCTFTGYVFRKYAEYLSIELDGSNETMFAFLNAIKNFQDNGDLLGGICSQLKTTPYQLYDSWKAWLYSFQPSNERYSGRNRVDSFLNQTFENEFGEQGLECFVPSTVLSEAVSLVPFLVYWKIMTDWYISPLLFDGDEEYYGFAYFLIDNNDPDYYFSGDIHSLSLCDRLYSMGDAFVTCTPSGDQPNVLLPNNPSVKDIRNMNRLQMFLERVSKTGKRYMDQILTTFGIQPNNGRLDRSEVLYRRSQFLDIQTVTQTNQADLNKVLSSPIGSQVGQSMTFQAFRGNTTTFDEHGFLVVIASIRPRASYFQGRNKFLTCLKATDFIVPDFAQIGDDEVKEYEIYCDYGAPENNPTFGYNQRYYNWMWHPSEVHGLMLNDLDYYHLGRRFQSAPNLNNNFVTVNVEQNDLNRIFTSYDNTPFLMWLNFNQKALRPLPTSTTYTL